MKIVNISELKDFLTALDKCEGRIILRSPHGDVYNLKSEFSKYIALGQLLSKHGDELELFCDHQEDEQIMLQFFNEHQEIL